MNFSYPRETRNAELSETVPGEVKSGNWILGQAFICGRTAPSVESIEGVGLLQWRHHYILLSQQAEKDDKDY